MGIAMSSACTWLLNVCCESEGAKEVEPLSRESEEVQLAYFESAIGQRALLSSSPTRNLDPRAAHDELTQIQSSFAEFDVNRDGFIDKYEFKSLLKRFSWKDEDVDELFKFLDAD